MFIRDARPDFLVVSAHEQGCRAVHRREDALAVTVENEGRGGITGDRDESILGIVREVEGLGSNVARNYVTVEYNFRTNPS